MNNRSLSVKAWIVLVWGSFVLLQGIQRALLIMAAWDREPATGETLLKTLITGTRGDLMTATYLLVVTGMMALLYAAVRLLFKRGFFTALWVQSFRRSAVIVGSLLVIVLLFDFGYFHFNQQRLNFVFFEYLGDLVTPSSPAGAQRPLQNATQSVAQTDAELQQVGKWGGRVLGFVLAQLMALTGWWWAVTRWIGPKLSARDLTHPRTVMGALIVCLLGGAMGFHSKGPYAIRIAPISSLTYYMLAQNPILYAAEGLRATLDSQMHGSPPPGLKLMTREEAIRRTQALLPDGGAFPSAQYPLVRTVLQPSETKAGSPPINIVVLFVEGLDRRFLGLTRRGVSVTPFLDRLKDESVYFDHFFSNGVQTSRGLLATLCSTYPRHGASAMKTRYTHDYLCMPELLRRAGYRTEMVISQHRDLNRLQLFLSRNGLQQLFDEGDFPPRATRLGLGYSDADLFDLVGARITALQAEGKPFFLSTLTLATHHPFAYPQDDGQMQALSQEADGYVPALHYTDRELERMMTGLSRAGLFRNTIVMLLGDHGRHEAVGATEIEKQVGHFMAPLLIWCDESLRGREECRPRTVSAIASQVDLAPTALGLLGLTPQRASFMGRDVSCEITGTCERQGRAFLSSVYDDLIGWADPEGLVVYSFRNEQLTAVDHNLDGAHQAPETDRMHERFRNMLALHIASNMLLDENRLWSWREWGAGL